MESTLNKPLVGNLVYSLLGKRGSGGWRGKPADWLDIRKDCPKNSIALYAAYNTPFTIVGNTTITKEGIVSNFSTSSYLKIENSITNTDIDEIVFKINIPSSALGNDNYMNIAYGSFSLYTYSSSSSFKYTGFNINGLGDLRIQQDLQPDTDYWIKYVNDGTNCTALLSTDGTNFTASETKEASLITPVSYTVTIGNRGGNDRVFNGSIDLNETYIKVNNEYLTKTPSYDNLGFTATCEGGYDVYIDGTQYGTTYTSGAQCDITWPTSGITTGEYITTPSLMKAHKIWVEPATEGNNITAFKCARVASSGTEQQGVLWAHFNITNAIDMDSVLSNRDNGYVNKLCEAVTAKGNKINLTSTTSWNSGLNRAFCTCSSLEYVPVFNTREGTKTYWEVFQGTNLQTVTLTRGESSSDSYNLFSDSPIKKIKGNFVMRITGEAFRNCQYLEELPNIDAANSISGYNFLTNAVSLKDTILDLREATNMTIIQCYGDSSHFMTGFKGLRVSNEAPFNDITSPQINVSYTGMDRAALVQLFNDLPYNVGYTEVGELTIDEGIVSGFSDSNYLRLSVLPNTLRDFDFVIKIKDLGSSLYRPILYAQGTNFQCFVSNGGGVGFNIGGNSYYNWSTPPSTGWVFLRYLIKNNKVSIGQSTNGIDWSMNSPEEITNPFNNFTNNASLCQASTMSSSSVDINNTYIKVNDVYWFKGQPAMTKTLSCVGATGTSDLTADDKDIALNKGWSLTLS